jgi:hypothetical protein
MVICLESISVRLAREQDFVEVLHLCTEAPLPVEDASFLGLRVYRSNGYGSDLVVHIHWSSPSSDHRKSLLGMQRPVTWAVSGSSAMPC